MNGQRINFILGNFNVVGGVEKVTEILSREFTNRNATVVIHSLYSKPTKNSSNGAIQVLHYGLTAPDNEKKLLNKIKRLILNGLTLRSKLSFTSGNFIFQGFYMAAYLPLLKISSERTIVCEHNTYNAPGKLSRIARIFIYKVCRPLLIVLTEADRRSYEAIGVKKVIKIHNPSPFLISSSSKTDSSKVLISVGRFTHQKRFNLMIELCSIPLKSHGDWSLVIQGEGEDLELMQMTALKSEVLQQTKIMPAGDTSELYQNGSIFLMTSKFEGLPMTLIESMSFGIPAVCFNCSPGLSEIIENGINGYLVDMDDSKSFIDKLSELMENPSLRKQMGDNAKQTASKFAVSKVISDWEKIFK